MKALTIKQPWASLIVAGVKDVENRGWRTTHRGPLLIHAATVDVALSADEWERSLTLLDVERHTLPRGAIIGQVTVMDCARPVASAWYEPGSWGWLLSDPERFTAPIPARGMPGLWTVAFDETRSAPSSPE